MATTGVVLGFPLVVVILLAVVMFLQSFMSFGFTRNLDSKYTNVRFLLLIAISRTTR